ncbi:MAG: DNA primase [Myxococcales bacterium]|nr:DNA primase [Myxococcales bacterium]
MTSGPDQEVREILARTSTVRLIGEFVTLKKMGVRYKGLCPFHQEKTPSFTVNEEQGFFHCFGCGEHGDAIEFLRKHNGMTFREALALLATRAGIELKKDRAADGRDFNAHKRNPNQALSEQCLETTRSAMELFHKNLLGQPRDTPVWRYITNRNITEQTVSEFRLGYAPPEWAWLADRFRSNTTEQKVAETLGLILPRKNGPGHYDRFRNRLIFPIFDTLERPIGFGGRKLPGSEEDQAAKYINSPDNPIYTKGDVLFGLAQAKKHARATNKAIIVEGNIDLLMLHQYGFRNAVAPMGTALTTTQVHLLRRFVNEVILLYDGDIAGRAASMKALHLLLEADVFGRVAVLPEGEDPDTYVQSRGSDALNQLLKHAQSLMEFLIEQTLQKVDGSAHSQAMALSELATYVSKVKDTLERDLYVTRIASHLRLPESRVGELLSEPTRAKQAVVQIASKPNNPVARASIRERVLVEGCLHYPACLLLVDDQSTWIEHDGLREVLSEAVALYGETGRLDGAELLSKLSGSLMSDWTKATLCSEPKFDEETTKKNTEQMLQLIRSDYGKNQRKRLQDDLETAERAGDVAKVKEVMRQLTELSRSHRRPLIR